MNIGLSLPHSYLSDSIVEADNVFMTNLGTADEALSALSNLIDYIEIMNFSTLTPPEQIVRAVRKIWKHGFKVSIHPSLPKEVEGKSLDEIYPWLSSILPNINKYQENLMLNLHALAAVEGDEKQLSKDTVYNLIHITKLIQKKKEPLLVAVELNRSKGEIDPCTTYEGVLDICRQVNSVYLGIGWDLGHTYANYQSNLISRNPPNDFLNRITHIHIHDLGPLGKTHWPLTMGVVPLEDYILQIKKSGYKGLYILELQPGRFAEHGCIKDLIIDSINILNRAVE